MKSICVFAGSNSGNNKLYEAAAAHLGEEIARRGVNLVYGGSRSGLMGTMADNVLKNGGTVTGIITHLLYELEGHTQLTKLYKTETMHERKYLMAQLADSFMVLPGGLGTLEELFEVWNAAKLHIHTKSIGLLNIDGFYTGLLDFIELTVKEGFAVQKNQILVRVSDNPACLLGMMKDKAA